MLPIDANIPFPPPSGLACRPSASSIIASKASPAKHTYTCQDFSVQIERHKHLEQYLVEIQ